MPLASTIDKQIASRSAFNTSSTLYTSTAVKPATSNPPDYKYIYQGTNNTNSVYIQPLGTPLFPGSTNDASHAT